MKEKIGISTWFLPATGGESFSDITAMIAEAGFNGLEISLGFGGTIGHPYTIPSIGLWPRDFDRGKRKRLRDELSGFDFVTVHAPHVGINIASVNPGIREESARQYIESVEFASDIGASIVTFHPGGPTPGVIMPEEMINEYDISFGKAVIHYAKERKVKINYEVTKAFVSQEKVLSALPGMGLTLDIGHAVLNGTDPLVWMESFRDRITEVHLNSVTKMWHGYVEHQPWDRNNVLDYPQILQKLRDIAYAGPFIFELQGIDVAQTLKICKKAQKMFLDIWNELR
ncbi:MAG: sugar phosphate isomerase/epimerase [Victivallaceae bacterium]|nr:sugar phosphate isomerase/epimerase [Victivallaceae bacterium]